MRKLEVVEISRRLARLRRQMAREGLDAYLVPSTDPHQSEFVPDCWQRRRWISGFCGSAGDVVVTRRRAGLWTDGRYALQARRELAGSGIELFVVGDEGVPELHQWVSRALSKNQVLGADSRLLSPFVARRLEHALRRSGARLRLDGHNLVDSIWTDRPALPEAAAQPHPQRYAGETSASKFRRLRKTLGEGSADALPIVALDEVAWLFNIRGADIAYSPLVVAYGLVTSNRALLFCDAHKIGNKVRLQLGRAAVELYPYESFGPALRQLPRARGRRPTVWVDERRTSRWVLGQLHGCPLLRTPSPVTWMKAQKNSKEIEGARSAHQRDGIAMVRLLHWLESSVPDGRLTELAVAAKLRELRAAGARFRGESFAPIVGYGPNAAIVHYSATSQTNARLRPRGLLLVDSGGQYADGTTDITRTVLLGGRATRAQRESFTRVLQGHIALARARFPSGTSGQQLDPLARAPLWQAGLDYAHGTGHGVGAYLSVHEGPQSIGKKGQPAPLAPGNILSDEPGYYEPGAYGIRIENLLLVQHDQHLSRADSTFLRFEVLTLCPIDTRLVDPQLLTSAERQWLNDYHARVRRELAGYVDPADRRWLARATRAI